MQIKRRQVGARFMQIYCHLYSALFKILCFMDISGEKNPVS